MDETPEERAVRLSRGVSEAVNGLALFLCTAVTGKLAANDLDRTLKHVARDHLPFLFDELFFFRPDLQSRPSPSRRIRAGLEGDRKTIVRMAEKGLDRDAALEMAALRQAIRNILLAVGLPLPAPAEGQCELHGANCPELDEG